MIKQAAARRRILHALVILVLTLGLRPPLAPAQETNVLSDAERDAGWVLLFDGTSTEGWTAIGSPEAWPVIDGKIVNHASAWGGGWLRTDNQYRDFELMLDFRIEQGANSGVGLRISAADDPAFTGMEMQIADTAGQEPSLTCCGALYDAIAPLEQAVRPAGEWNTYRIMLVGDQLNAWLNGRRIHMGERLDSRGFRHEPSSPLPLSSRVRSGYIGLQDHGGGVEFRNIRMRPISVQPLDHAPRVGEPRWEDLFNGRDLEGWFARGNAEWSVEAGQIVGRGGGPGHLYSQGVYSDFDLRAKVMINTAGNSGFYFRAIPPRDNPDGWPDGYEAQVDHRDPVNYTGSLYGRVPASALLTRENEWFDYNVRAVGDHITIAINGALVVDTHRSEWTSGHVALQGHHPTSEVRWRDIQIRNLDGWQEVPDGSGRITRKDAVSARTLSDGVVDVFYCTHSAGFVHDVLPESRRIMEELDRANDWLRVRTSNDIADLTPEVMASTDVIMFYTTGSLPMTADQKSAFQAFVEGGRGFVGVHSATDTFADWPWYVNLVGGTFDGHPWHELVGVSVDHPDHPAMRPFGGSRFTITDEIYQIKNYPKDRYELMRLDTASVTHDVDPDRNYAMAWTARRGQGRVYYNALGHRIEVWHDSRFTGSLLGGIRWVAGLED